MRRVFVCDFNHGWHEEPGCPQGNFSVNGTESRDVLKGTSVFPEDIPVEVPYSSL